MTKRTAKAAADVLPGGGTTANARRGEQTVMLEGVEYVMRPSFAAIEAIETKTGKALAELMILATAAKLKGVEIAVIVTECVKADLRQRGRGAEADMWQERRVAELLMDAEGGLFKMITDLVGFLKAAATGEYTSKGELKAAAGSPTGDIPAAA